MMEIEEVKGVEDPAITYEYVKGILNDLDKMALYLVKQERLDEEKVRLDAIIPRAKDLIRKELNVKLLELRAEIREQLDKDERQQLKLPEPAESKTEEPAAGIPKNDYRRHRNGSEEDDGK